MPSEAGKLLKVPPSCGRKIAREEKAQRAEEAKKSYPLAVC